MEWSNVTNDLMDTVDRMADTWMKLCLRIQIGLIASKPEHYGFKDVVFTSATLLNSSYLFVTHLSGLFLIQVLSSLNLFIRKFANPLLAGSFEGDRISAAGSAGHGSSLGDPLIKMRLHNQGPPFPNRDQSLECPPDNTDTTILGKAWET
ncbi:hypothetical protein GQX74_005903 [Glossina fuscipes]|nr:hypothetical protein GQX74_005903 [Glossina fuscipes]